MISKLASGFVESPNHYNGRTAKICKFTPHHVAGIMTAEQIANVFKPRSRNASANYVIGDDGKIICCVDESNGAWTSSSKWNDNQAITVEVSNCEYGGEWKVSDEAWNSLVELAVDVCTRYGFKLEYDGTANGSLTEHRMYVPTACPGPYLHSKMKELADTVNARLEGKEVTKTPQAIKTSTEPDYTGLITYQACTGNGNWLPEVNKCDNTPDGYAGINNVSITGFRCKPENGDITYVAHVKGFGWLEEVNSKDYIANDTKNGNTYAGIYGKTIDAIKIKSSRGYVDYRVKTKECGWLPWVRDYNDYAGNFGQDIIAIQMK